MSLTSWLLLAAAVLATQGTPGRPAAQLTMYEDWFVRQEAAFVAAPLTGRGSRPSVCNTCLRMPHLVKCPAAWSLSMSQRRQGGKRMPEPSEGGGLDHRLPDKLMPKPLRPELSSDGFGGTGTKGALVPDKIKERSQSKPRQKVPDPRKPRDEDVRISRRTPPASQEEDGGGNREESVGGRNVKNLAETGAGSSMVTTGDLFNGIVDPCVLEAEGFSLYESNPKEFSSVDHRLVNFRRASIERNMAIRARQRRRWEQQRSDELSRDILQGSGGAPQARAFNVTEEQNQWYNLISGASFRSTQNSSVLYYESVLEKVIQRVAKWTKETPSVDRLLRPIDAILDAFLNLGNKHVDRELYEEGKRRYTYFGGNRRRMYPLPVPQGFKYPVRMTNGVRSGTGTIYSMQDQPGSGVKKKRKELRLVSNVSSAWYGDPTFPWVETVEDSDGTWIRVGRDVTEMMRRRIHRGVLSVPLPFEDVLGDPCAGVFKSLMINYTDKAGESKSVGWNDSSGYAVDYLQAIRATYSLQRLANIMRGDISEVDEAINETRPLIAAMRQYLRASEPGKAGKTYELEARLGFVQGIDGLSTNRARFENGVSREFMDRVLDLCEEWNDWIPIKAWSESHDFIFRVGNIQMRTSVSCDDPATSLDPSTGHLDALAEGKHVRRTVKKRILKLRDYSYVSTLGGVPRTGMLSADVRVALSEETEVNEDELPEWGKERRPLRVRIKQRRSFHYTPPGSSRPVWRFDFTLVWAAKSLARAQVKQRIEEPAFELECELLDPRDYLEQEPDDTVVAKGLLLKLRDFLEPWGGYRLHLVSNKPFPAGNPRRYRHLQK